MDIETGDVIEGIVSGYGSDGEGVIRIDRFPVFVPFCLEGENVRVKITYVKKDCAFGSLLEVITPSPDRVKPRCPYFLKCGGCDLQHASKSLQLEIKRREVENVFKKNAISIPPVSPPVSLNEWEYRNKLALPFAYNKRSGRVSLGFYEKRTHKVVPIKWCALHGEWASVLITCITDWANECGVSVYDETTGKGLLRHAVARNLDTLSLTLVINGKTLPHQEELIEKLKASFCDFTLYISPNEKSTNGIFGESVVLLYGKEEEQSLGAFKATVSPKSFLQVNNLVRDALYDEVGEKLRDFKGDLIELYSGVGILTAQLALRLPDTKIISVEIEKSATDDAKKLMRKLKIDDRVTCINGDARKFLSDFITNENREAGKNFITTETVNGNHKLEEHSVTTEKADTNHEVAIILDPPRRGVDREILSSLPKFGKIIYISCNPQTLARDVKLLKGYEIESIKLFDMFPNTSSVETFCELTPIKCEEN